MPEDKPKIQVSQHFWSWKYWSELDSWYWLAHTCIKLSSPSALLFLFNHQTLKSFPLSPECHPPAAVGSVPLYDGPSPGPDGGYRDSQTLCLQPAGGSAHSGTTELALPQGHIWNPCYWCAGRLRNGKSWVKCRSSFAFSLKNEWVTLLTPVFSSSLNWLLTSANYFLNLPVVGHRYNTKRHTPIPSCHLAGSPLMYTRRFSCYYPHSSFVTLIQKGKVQ